MRKIYKIAAIACLGLLLSIQNSNAQLGDFENLTLPAESYWDGSDLSGIHNNGIFTSEFMSGDFTFPNVFDTTFGMPGYWLGGFAYSNMTDSVTSGAGNKYSAKAGGGSSSANYTVGQNNSSFTGNTLFDNLIQFDITNSTYAYNSMRDGDAFAKKFGGVTGNDPDWFMVTVTLFSSGFQCESLDIYLADFRFTNNTQDYMIKDWQSFSIGSMCMFDSIYFELSSSDTGTWGMNTPPFFCIDNIELMVWDNINELNTTNFSFYPNPASSVLTINYKAVIEKITISAINGQILKNYENIYSNQLKIDVADLKSGIYFVQVISNGIPQTKKFIKQ